MYAGETIEVADIQDLFRDPLHPYTSGLLHAVRPMQPGQRFVTIPGQVPSPATVPEGCHFHPRCEHAVTGICTAEAIELRTVRGREVRCARAEEIDLPGVEP
jgi:oligopeptide/dipeptide ABC transporter ATP-binding protein